MNKMKTIYLVSAALCLAANSAAADDAKVRHHADNSTTTATDANSDSSGSSNSDSNYKYDRMEWDHSIPAWSNEALMNNSGPDYCLPRRTVVIGQSASLKTVTNDTGSNGASGSKDTTQASKSYLAVTVDPGPLFGQGLDDANKKIDMANGKVDPSTSKGIKLCEGVDTQNDFIDGQEVYVDPTDALRWGWEYGALAVPFKMQLGGKNAFSGDASIGPYLGFKFPIGNSGIALSPVAFAGASAISVPNNSGGKSNSQTMAGLSYGVGVIGEVKDSFQVGVIFGKDHVDSGNYQYNDKTWISFAIGYSFAR